MRERERSVGRAGLAVLVVVELDVRVAWADGAAPRLRPRPPFTVRPCDETAIGERLMFLIFSVKNNHTFGRSHLPGPRGLIAALAHLHLLILTAADPLRCLVVFPPCDDAAANNVK